MTCEFSDKLAPFHDDELSDDQAAAVRAHLETCAECRAARQALVDVGAALRAELDAVRAPTPAEQLAALTEVLTAARAPLWRRRVAVPVPVLGGLVVAALAFAVIATVARRDRPASEEASPGGRLVIEVVKRPSDSTGSAP